MKVKAWLSWALGCVCFLLGMVVWVLVGCQTSGTVKTATPTSAPPTWTATSVSPTVTPTSAPELPSYSDVPYVPEGDRKQVLHIYLPEHASGPLPTLLILRGLDWVTNRYVLAPRAGYDELGKALVDRGYAVVLADYRYPSEPLQDQMTRDAFCALAWVHANAENHGFDAHRIAVLGDHFGASIAAKLGAVDDPGPYLEGCPHSLPESEWLKGVVTYGAKFHLPGPSLEVGERLTNLAAAHTLLSQVPYNELVGIFETLRDLPPGDWRDSPELGPEARDVARLLPAYWVDGSEAPFLIIDGEQDLDLLSWGERGVPVPSGESAAFAAELQAAGVRVEFVVLPGIKLNSLQSGESSAEVLEAIESFLSEILE